MYRPCGYFQEDSNAQFEQDFALKWPLQANHFSGNKKSNHADK